MDGSKLDPIRIVDVVTDEVTMPAGDGLGGSLYAVPLRLSRRPSALWAELFVETWDRPPRFSTMHRPGIARIIGDRIVLDGTTIDEIEKYHRDTLVLCVKVANEREAESLRARRNEEERRQRRAADHRRQVEEKAKKLSFD